MARNRNAPTTRNNNQNQPHHVVGIQQSIQHKTIFDPDVIEHYSRLIDNAEAVAEAFQEALAESLPVTRDYLDARLYEMENRMVKWGIGLALGQFAMIAALIKLL